MTRVASTAIYSPEKMNDVDLSSVERKNGREDNSGIRRNLLTIERYMKGLEINTGNVLTVIIYYH